MQRRADNEGVALIAVLMVMLVGFIAVASIAAAAMFVIRANVTNKGTTQSFIAAESGRDQMLARYLASCATSIPDSTATAPLYKNVIVVSSGPDDARQTSPATCASATQTTVFDIVSTGIGPDGSTSTVTSTYNRTVTYTNQPGGSLAYLSGTFTLTQSEYTGDIVIRDNTLPWDCNSHSTIDGDLWVLHGDVVLSSTCKITGSIYAGGSVTIKSANTEVDGSIVSAGFINLTGNNLTLKGDLLATSDISVDKSAKFSGGATQTVKSGGTATVPGTPPAGGVFSGVSPSPAVFNPSIATVYAMTTWMDISATQPLWGSDVQWVTPSSCSADVTSYLTTALSAPYMRVGVDYSACTATATINIATPASVKHDVVFLVPPKVQMVVNISQNLTSTLPAPPQLFFIHGDANLTNSLPDCGTGSSPTDAINLPATMTPYVMFYTPCGIKQLPKNAFNGQYYAGNNSDPHWVQPTLTCQPMAWAPLINLGCKIAQASNSNNGTVQVSILPPILVSQTER